MQTPTGGHRHTQWAVQYRLPPVTEGQVQTWTRQEVPGDPSGPQTRQILGNLRTDYPAYEWRAIRIETTQRVEDW